MRLTREAAERKQEKYIFSSHVGRDGWAILSMAGEGRRPLCSVGASTQTSVPSNPALQLGVNRAGVLGYGLTCRWASGTFGIRYVPHAI